MSDKKYKVIVSNRAKRMFGTHIRFMAQVNKDATFLFLPAAWRWVCISFSVHGLVRKPSVGFVS